MSGNRSVVRARDSSSNGPGFGPPAGAAGEFSSLASTFCAHSYFGIRSIPVLTKQQVTDSGHSAKSAGGRLQLNTHAPYLCGFECDDIVD